MELEKQEITSALIAKRFYNPYDVFNHAPDFYICDDIRYKYRIEIVKWNTRSARVTVLYARFDDKKQAWVFSKRIGLKRTPHGEKMR